MSASSNPPHRPKSNSLRPRSAGSGAGSMNLKTQKKGSPIMQKLAAIFRRDRNTEDGVVPVRPACFDDKYERRHSESPEPVGVRNRASSGNSKNIYKTKKGKDVGSPGGPMWKPRGRLEWDSDSGRQITIQDVPVNDLSKVEVQALQRQAVTSLQGMDIPVSHGLLKGSRNVLGRLSFNNFKQKQRVNGNEKPGEVDQQNVIFGQPLTKVLGQDTPKSLSAAATPISSPLPRNLYPSSVSPTSTTSSESFVDGEPNPTAQLLETISLGNVPSPKTQRRQSLYRSDPQVPSIVKKAIHYLDTKGVKTEGIFRVPGAKSRIDEIREMFDSGQDVELTDDMNPHDVACLLKEFFRSLPEPLLTRELFHAYLATRKITNLAQRRDALRHLCLLLPQVNRDTLQELLQFLARVALHSNGIILIDGTEETGNRMSEQNLAMIIGPNILHKELKKKTQKGDYQVQKQDPEELINVCKVIEDLITMQQTIFVIPAQWYDSCLKGLMATDPEAVDHLLKRRCIEQGLYLTESESGLVSRSRSSEALRRISRNSNESYQLAVDFDFSWKRSRSLSDTQKALDDAIRDLEQYTDFVDEFDRERHFSSTDSAMGESDQVLLSPIQLPHSEPSTLNRKRQVFNSRDSAFSNNSSPTNSSEGVNNSDIVSLESDSPFIPYGHTRMSSGISGVSSSSPVPPAESPELSSSPQLNRKLLDQLGETSSLPGLGSPDRPLSPSENPKALEEKKLSRTLPLHTSLHNTSSGEKQEQHSRVNLPKRSRKLKTLPSFSKSGTYNHKRSPILSSRDPHMFHSESRLDSISSDHTPTDSTSNIPVSASYYSLDGGTMYHCNNDDGTVI